MRDPGLCLRCGAPLVKDEIAMTRKMVNRGADSFFCYSCLAEHFQVSVETLRKKAEEFKAMGCTLFQ